MTLLQFSKDPERVKLSPLCCADARLSASGAGNKPFYSYELSS